MRPLWHAGLSPVWGPEPLSCQHWSQFPESPDRCHFQLTPHHESRRVSLPAGQATLALFCQVEETAWLSSFHQPFSLSSSCRMPSPPGAPAPRQPRARAGSSPLGAVPSMPRGGMWSLGVFCTLPFLSPQLDLGFGPGFPGSPVPPLGCPPSGCGQPARGLLPALPQARPERSHWAVRGAHLRSIRCHVLTCRCFCDYCGAPWQRGTVIP